MSQGDQALRSQGPHVGALKASLYALFDVFNICLFWLWAKFATARAYPLTFAPSDKVLLLAPHADDETIGAGGTLRRHVEAEAGVTCCILTDGAASKSAASGTALVGLRQEEARRACALFGVQDVRFFDMPDGQVSTQDDGRERLVALLKWVQPSIIYSPSFIDVHPDHIATFHMLASALQDTAQTPEIRLYEVQVPLTATLFNRFTEVSQDAALIHEILYGCYKSQTLSFRNFLARRQINALFCPGARMVEVFLSISTAKAMEISHWIKSSRTGLELNFFGSGSPLGLIKTFLKGRRTRLALLEEVLQSSHS